MERVVKAYKNIEFLNSPDARIIRILAEYLEPASRFKKYGIQDTIVFFGSARIHSLEHARNNLRAVRQKIRKHDGDPQMLATLLQEAQLQVKLAPYYEDARRLAYMITLWSKEHASRRRKNTRRFIVCSGGGPGIMEAANRGASEAGGYSIGLNISLPFEQEPNHYISKELCFEFHYFFIRKFWFAYLAKALIVFPGGFGTIDEMMELLTLVQTHKITKPMPIILYGSRFWKKIINFDELAALGMISSEDLNLMHFVDTPEEAYSLLTRELTRLLQQ
ncbi:MAG: TIGR00730 family Rossman fold protein [Desulfobacterota bacterium]|nr:TIGR00730 family Rossman fold protein [Thermodesulfobacteriota bacterium]